MSEESNVDSPTPEQMETEKEARQFGWVPKEDFRDGEHWVDAETFVKRGKEINPILRKNNETLLKKLEAAQQEVAEVKKVAKEFEKFQKDQATKKVKELETQLAVLKEQKKTAISAGDGDTAVAIDEQIDAIKEEQYEAKATKKEAEEPKVVVPATLDPVITNWMDENKWFTTDMKMTRTADIVGTRINQEHPTLRGKAFFDKLDEELRETVPEYFKKKERVSPVEGNTSGTSRSSNKKQSYESLPSESKAACDRFVKQGLMTREQYLSEYDWD